MRLLRDFHPSVADGILGDLFPWSRCRSWEPVFGHSKQEGAGCLRGIYWRRAILTVLRVLFVFLLFGWCVAPAFSGPTMESLNPFVANPLSPLGFTVMDGQGSLWGTGFGGSQNKGAIFKITAPNDDLEIITVVDFDGANGSFPLEGLVSDGAGHFWGMTSSGGAENLGTIFKVNVATGVLSTVASFSGANGGQPSGRLVSDGAGNFWGTTGLGGANNFGTVFKVNTSSGILTAVASFDEVKGKGSPGQLTNDGVGNLWATTGSDYENNLGTVFKVNIASGILSTVVIFTGPNGDHPNPELINDGAGNLWGTTARGGIHTMHGPGTGPGTVFKIDTLADTFTTVVSLTSNSGDSPSGGIFSDGAGHLWGLTSRGGSFNAGTIFKVNMASGALSIIHHFPLPESGSSRFGKTKLVPDGAGNLWGTTLRGGEGNDGTIYKVNMASGALTFFSRVTSITDLYNDGAGNFWGTSRFRNEIFKFNIATGQRTGFSTGLEYENGSNPRSSLVSDGTGHLWGVAESGGTSGFGTLFKIHAETGFLTVLHNFDGSNGKIPKRLVRDGLGNLWGLLRDGVGIDLGALFRVDTATGEVTPVVSFDGANGRIPSLSEFDENGLIWGMTLAGGNADFGTIFKVDPATNTFTTVVNFTGANGKYPTTFTTLLAEGEGILHGTANLGGTHDFGTIFQIDKSTGSITTLLNFTGANGKYPSGVIRDGAGNLWGMTEGGGSRDLGTVFKFDPVSKELRTVVSFTGVNGKAPGMLLDDGNGTIWGTCFEGGSRGMGTVFRVDSATGSFRTVVNFTGANGKIPWSLVADGAGNLWGTTPEGGLSGYRNENGSFISDYGTVFRIDSATNVLSTVVHFPSWESGYPFGDLTPDGQGFFWGSTRLGRLFRVRYEPVRQYFVGGTPDRSLSPHITRQGEITSVKGLPPGLSYDKKTESILGRPTKSGTFTFTVGISQDGIEDIFETQTVTVSTIPDWAAGSFTALIPPPSPADGSLLGLGGIVSLRVNTLGVGTGSLRLGSKQYAMRGVIEYVQTSPAGGYFFMDQALRPDRKTPLQDVAVKLELRPESDSVAPGLAGSLTQGSAILPIGPGWQHTWNAKSNPAFQGIRRTINTSFGNSVSEGPRGRGLAMLDLRPDGRVNWAGLLADGRVFTSSSFASPGLELAAYSPIAYPDGGAFLGLMGTELYTERIQVTAEGYARWIKYPTISKPDAVYSGGFDLELIPRGAEYSKPGRGEQLFGNPDSLIPFFLEHGGIGAEEALSPFLQGESVVLESILGPGNKLSLQNFPGPVRANLNSATGRFSASAVLAKVGAKPRTLRMEGLYIPHLSNPSLSTVEGFFLLPQPSESTTLSGSLISGD